ncbi:MAG TPA: tRNA (adenosine(37)-N6)-dimethylallyltransferase MiaA [Flavobacterium sp.]|jgi:tRNA dimethylallyltransferase|nr:tRNA (adenosine(37)-N6)-dimethylallyltransferase MiaA [Flavobacterium sp.]
MKYLITIIGPTAIGKTALAIKVAQHFQCEIISCDSRQFYREMYIGTAVPSPEELAAAPHHFIHNRSIHDNYTVGDFEKEAIAKLDELFLKGDFAVMVGGSGLYVDAVLKGFDQFPEVDAEVRQNLQVKYEEHGITFLQTELQERDPEYYATVDINNPQRVLRALEICIHAGKPYSSFLGIAKPIRNFTPIIIGLDADREILYERINRRVDIMMEQGLEDEVRNLIVYKRLNALQTVGYRELISYFEGEFSLEQAVAEIKKNTRRFAKRQLTWFRRTEGTMWFDYEVDASEIIEKVRDKVQ